MTSPLSPLSPQSLTSARLQLHYAIQPIAAAGNALVSSEPDGSHSSLKWDTSFNGLVGNMIRAKQDFQIALNPVNLTLQILDETGSAIANFSLHQKNLAQVMEWLTGAIATLGVNTNPLQLLSYPSDDFPDHPIAHGALFDSSYPEARVTLAKYYSVSHLLLQEIVTKTASASPVHIWPHHFDIATLITLPAQNGISHTIGVGLSPGDSSYSEPYWYVSPYPYPDITSLPDLAGLGIWHTAHWVGAVLTASSLHQDLTDSKSVEQIRRFLEHAIEVLR